MCKIKKKRRNYIDIFIPQFERHAFDLYINRLLYASPFPMQLTSYMKKYETMNF